MKGKIIGFEKVMVNLNKEILKIKGRTLAGLIESAIVIRRDMDTTPPLIPVDLGNLRASWFVTTSVGTTEEGKSPDWKGEADLIAELSTEHANATSEGKGIATASLIKPMLIMGFSANYAVFVHENTGANFAGDPEKAKKGGKFLKFARREGAGAKFFEQAIDRNKDKIIKIIQKNAQIK